MTATTAMIPKDVAECLKSRWWRLNNLYYVKDKSGNKVKFNLNWAQKVLYKEMHYCNIILKARQLGMCLDPDTKILKADLTWVRIADINPGDEIVSVQEHPEKQGKARRLKKGIVEGVISFKRKTYKITFDNGKSLICTGKHPWLSRKKNTEWEWRTIENDSKKKLTVGTKIRRVTLETWEKGDFEDGWMGGMLDGEGSISNSNRAGVQISVSQLKGNVFDRMIDYFKKNNYSYRIEDDTSERKTKYGKAPVPKITLTRIDEVMKLIGVTRPTRFLNKNWWVDRELPNIKNENCYSTITKIEYLGERDVVDLQTSEGTYIAEGYVSHNTTFFAIYFLDMCIFNSNINAAIVADRNSNSREIFRDKVKFAYDNLNPVIKNIAPAHRDNANEYRFENGSSYRVACSLRGGTTQLLHISEFGKICREFPKKAQEIVAGALNTVQAGQFITIESTAEGRDGYFYDMVHTAQKKQDLGEKLGPMDYKLFFFPWYKEKSYTLDFSDEEAKRIENKIVVA